MRHRPVSTVQFATSLLSGLAFAQAPQDNGVEAVAATTAAASPLHLFTSLDVFSGVNDVGQVGLTGRRVGQAGDQAVLVDTDGTLQVFSFASGSSNRDFAGAALSNPISSLGPYLASRDRVSGSPPSFRVRTWQNGTFSIIGRNPAHFDSASLWLDVNDQGVVAFTGLQNGSTVLYAEDTEPPSMVATFSGNQQIRPQISNTNEIVYRSPLGSIEVVGYLPPSAPTAVAGPSNGYVAVGTLPGISDDGTAVGFTGDLGAGDGVFLAIKDGASYQIIQVDGAGSGFRFPSVVRNSRVGVAVSEDFYGKVATLTYLALNGGVTVLCTAQVHIEGPPFVLSRRQPRVVLATGDTVGTETVTSLFTYDPASKTGWIAAGAVLQGGSAILRYSPRRERPFNFTTEFRKHKQFSGAWSNLCVVTSQSGTCPGTSNTYTSEGCTITSFATAVEAALDNTGISVDVTPLDARNQIYVHPTKGTVNLAACTHTALTPDGSSYVRVRMERDPADDFDTILNELQAGRPVVLAVPSASNSSDNNVTRLAAGRLHYIVAYGYDADAGIGESQGILINDAGNGNSRYAETAGPPAVPIPGYSPASAPLRFDRDVHVTLHDYFALVSRRATFLDADYQGTWGEDPARDNQRIREWFDEGRFYYKDQNGQTVTTTVQAGTKDNLIAKTVVDAPVALPVGLPIANPFVMVGSPVEVRVTQPGGSVGYVSDPALAQSGDTVVPKLTQLRIIPPDGPYIDFDPVFPPYSIELPQSLAGTPLDIEIIGVGAGPYDVAYESRDVTIASASTNGAATLGSSTMFNVSAQPLACGGNPADSLLVVGAPTLGTTVDIQASNPVGTQASGAVSLFAFTLTGSLFEPCGLPLPGFGMSGPGSNGELLVFDLLATLLGSPWFGATQPAVFSLSLPADPTLVGTVLYSQALLADLSVSASVPFGLTNRVRIEITQ